MDQLIKHLIPELQELVAQDLFIYPIQKQIILKLLSTIELVLDNNFEGTIKVDKNLLHIEEN
jgi:hypothetical protein